MRELSLNILDIVQNSLTAKATKILITLDVSWSRDLFSVTIEDNGCGIEEEMLKKICDPFTTSRTTRSVGMGVPLFKYSAESAGGNFEMHSTVGKGTMVKTQYQISHIDRMPLGDFEGTILSLILLNDAVDFVVTVRSDKIESEEGVLDTAEMREVLGGIPLSSPDVMAFLREYFDDNLVELYKGL